MNEKNEKNKNKNYFSNLGDIIKKGSESITNKLMDKLSDVLEKSKISKHDDKEIISPNQSDKKITMNKTKNSDTQNILTIQEDEDHKIYKYCLDYDEEDDDLEEEGEESGEDDIKQKLNQKEISTETSQIMSENAFNSTPKLVDEQIQNSLIAQKEINPHIKVNLGKSNAPDNNINLSPNVRYNFDKFDYSNKVNPRKNSVNKKENHSDYDSLEYVTTCHRLYAKDTMVDLDGLKYFKSNRIKKKNKILSYIGLGENKLKIEKYIILLDEFFIYFIKDNSTSNANKENENFRKVGNHHDIRKISNIDAKDMGENKLKITIVFNLSNDSINNFESKMKEFEIEKEEAGLFIPYLKSQLLKYNIQIML